MFCSSWRASLPILLLTLCFTSLPMFTEPVQAAETTTVTRVYGKVVDYATGLPITNAPVILTGEIYEASGLTDASGNYEIEVKHWGDYWAYAFLATIQEGPTRFLTIYRLRFDYVPAIQRISVAGASLNVSFRLLPGASIYVAGDFGPFGSPPTPRIGFTVIDQNGLLNETNAMREYGYLPVGTPLNIIQWRMGLDDRTVVVPAHTPVRIEAEAFYWRSGSERFTIPGGGRYLNLTQGSQITINLHVIWLAENPDYMPEHLQSVQAMTEEAEGAGFYVSYERNRLFRAGNLMDAAHSALSGGDYDAAYADFHEANLIIVDTETALQSMYFNAYQSVFFITPFLGFTAVVLASTLFDGRRKRLATSLSLYISLFGLLYLLYPGYTVLQKVYNPWGGAPLEGLLLPLLVVPSFLAAHFVILYLPYRFKERTSVERLRPMSAVASAFSVAARNLKRRRLRTLLTATFMLISVFAFTTLTSLSFEEGFTIQPKPGQAPSDGFLIRKPLRVGYLYIWSPIEPAILQWLQGRPETALSAPKMENTPVKGVNQPAPPLTAVYAPKSGLSFNISGALGVYPSLEAKITKMDRIITQGHFLNDGDLNGILISREAAEKLQVGVNDTIKLFDQAFNVTGIFDSGKLEGLGDLDGEPLLPYKVEEWTDGQLTIVERTPGSEVVIVHAETAQRLPGMMISRINVQTRSPEDIMGLTRLAVLLWPGVEAFASMAGKIHHVFIGPYIVAMGFAETVVPLALVILNVGLMMLSAVYERRREVFTMSSVGLNPSHITAVFVAEALVIGIVAGSLGYVLGLASYRLMVISSTVIGVKQKVEAIWSILALCLSIGAAVLGTAIPALKASLIATPSLIRRWKISVEEKPKLPEKPKKLRFRLLSWLAPKYRPPSWRLTMPIQIQKGEIEDFFSFMENRLREYATYRMIENLKVSGRGADIHLTFTYIYSEERIVTNNELFAVKSHRPNRYDICLASKTLRGTIEAIDEADIQQTATFIRSLILQYSAISAPKDGNTLIQRRGNT